VGPIVTGSAKVAPDSRLKSRRPGRDGALLCSAGRPGPRPVADQAAPADDPIAVLVRHLAHDMLPQTAAFAADVNQKVLDAVPALAPHSSPEEIAVILESSEQNIGAILATMAFGVAADATAPPVTTVALFPQIEAGGGDITDLLHAYRVGHDRILEVWGDYLLDRIGLTEEFYPALRMSSAHIFEFINGACQNLVLLYHARYGGPTRASLPRDHVMALLGEEPVDLDAAALALRYDPRAHHVGLVAVPLAGHVDVRAALEDLAAAMDGATLLAHAAGDGTWWAWLGWPQTPEEKVLDELAARPLTDIIIGLGEPGRGREGFRRSHAQAHEAERTARLSVAAVAGVVRQRDIEVAALLCADPERARRVAADRLGLLAARDEPCARLRTTVRTYLACGRSVTRTAETLHVHQKTVSYRLARAAALLGHPISQSTRELEAALLVDLTLHGS
jgi:hypothetical protein